MEHCDIYVGLFGQEYGTPDTKGVAQIEWEFDSMTALYKHQLIFLNGATNAMRDVQMATLIARL